MRKLRLNDFQPGEEYVYLTYSMKNDKREESETLLENYRVLLQKALDWLWEKTRIERKEVKGKKATKVEMPKKKEVYKVLRDELEKTNTLASHYVDKAINDAYSMLRGWRRRAEKGQASLRKPRLKRVYVRVKSTLRKVEGESVRITVRPYEYITFSLSLIHI